MLLNVPQDKCHQSIYGHWCHQVDYNGSRSRDLLCIKIEQKNKRQKQSHEETKTNTLTEKKERFNLP